MTTLYGIKTCETVRKARRWLQRHNIDYRYRDFREDAISRAEIEAWANRCAPESLLNRRSRTWKQLDAGERARVDAHGTPDLLSRHVTLIKRPVLELDGEIHIGYSEAEYAAIFGGK